MMLDQGAIDRLLDVIGGDRADLAELVQSFLDEAPALAATIDRALATGDINALKRAAHGLKSGARDFGAVELAGLCARIELRCREGALDGLDGAEVQVARLFEEARADLEQLLLKLIA
jgi:HPt (histidine-containing phosphotransfer) domain-containing protein